MSAALSHILGHCRAAPMLAALGSPPREGKIETDGERVGGILPPLAPKPTS